MGSDMSEGLLYTKGTAVEIRANAANDLHKLNKGVWLLLSLLSTCSKVRFAEPRFQAHGS